jgi:hypothetical protein
MPPGRRLIDQRHHAIDANSAIGSLIQVIFRGENFLLRADGMAGNFINSNKRIHVPISDCIFTSLKTVLIVVSEMHWLDV